MRNFIAAVVLLALSLPAVAAEQATDTTKTTNSDLSYSLEIKSRQSWRGGLTTSNMNVQPTIEYAGIKNLTLGAWGCYAVNNNYAEVDLYANYSIGNFGISLYDYFNPVPSEDAKHHHFFNFDKKETGHLIDFVVDYTFSSVPIKLLASSIIYGGDINENNNNRYSTYFEASYSHTLKSGQHLCYFVGGTPHESMYYKEANIVNVGFKLTQDVKLGGYNLPVSGSIVVNPARGNIYFIAGICLF